MSGIPGTDTLCLVGGMHGQLSQADIHGVQDHLTVGDINLWTGVKLFVPVRQVYVQLFS